MKNTKSLLALFMACMMVVSCFVITPVVAVEYDSVWDGETVTTSWYDAGENEFVLDTADELAGLASLVNEGNTFEGKTVTLGANIDLASNAWTPIGTVGGTAFKGTFDGANKYIGNLSATCENAALFGYGSDATIQNLKVDAANVDSTGYVAVLVAYADGSGVETFTNVHLTNCFVNNSTAAGTTPDTALEGGTGMLMGRTDSTPITVTSCSATGSVTGVGNTGGVLGYYAGTDNYTININNFESDITVVGQGGSLTSGMIGHIVGASLNVNQATLNGSFSSNYQGQGGIVGGFTSGETKTVTISGVTSNMVANASASRVGGFIGGVYTGANVTSIAITGCEINGNVKGNQYTGGMIGLLEAADIESVTISDSYINGTVTSASQDLGGLIGYVKYLGSLNVTDCDVTNSVTSTNTSETRVGGLVGYFWSSPTTITITRCDIGGDGKTVSGTQFVGGLIGKISDSTVPTVCETLTIDTVTVSGTVSGSYWVGGFIGGTYVNPKEVSVDNSHVYANISETSGSYNHGCGGMFGAMPRQTSNATSVATVCNMTITNSTVEGTVTGGQTGGIIGGAAFAPINLSVDGCTISGAITGTKAAGGLVGNGYKLSTIEVNGTNVSGNIQGLGGSSGTLAQCNAVGGMIGTTAATSITVTNSSVASETISTTSNNGYNGGFIGDLNAPATVEFDNCYIVTSMSIAASRLGGFVGDYNQSGGSFTFRDCYADVAISGTYAIGGLIGYASHSNAKLVVENTVVVGSLSTSNADYIEQVGAIVGRIGTDGTGKTTPTDNSISNFYYNVSFSGGSAKLGIFQDYEMVEEEVVVKTLADTFATCTYYTPGEDNTEGLEKQPNIKIVEFLEAMKGSTLEVEHTCTPVEMDQENAVKTATMTLECQVPGCKNHKLADATDLFAEYGSSIRVTGNPGMRFVFGIDPLLDAGRENVNVGVVMMPNELLGGAALTIYTENALVIPAAKIFTENNKDYHEGVVTFSGVLTSIPSTVEAWNTVIAVRAYVQIGDTVYYSATYGASYKSTAEAIKAAGGEDYTDNQTFIDNIIAENVSAQ